MEEENIRKRIIQVLNSHEISMRQLSNLIGKSDAYVSNVMKGKGFPSLELVYKILVTYQDVSPTWLLFGENETDSLQNLKNRVDYKKLYDETREENKRLNDSLERWRDAMLQTMKKNEELMISNANLLAQNCNNTEQ